MVQNLTRARQVCVGNRIERPAKDSDGLFCGLKDVILVKGSEIDVKTGL